MCMVDGSWTFTDLFSRIGWVWKDNTGKIQLMGTQNLRRRETTLHSELEALKWALESMLQHSNCQHFGTDCKDLIAMIKEPQALAKLFNGTGSHSNYPHVLFGFQDHLRAKNT